MHLPCRLLLSTAAALLWTSVAYSQPTGSVQNNPPTAPAKGKLPKTSVGRQEGKESYPARLHIAMGMPAKATTDPNNREAFLIVRPQFVTSYNDRTRTPNWVSWHLNRQSLPKNHQYLRQEFFTIDTLLPQSFIRVEHFDYHKRYGFDRGHMCPAADRSLSDTDNAATFLTTNIVPQSPNNNQLGWERFERFCRELASQNQEVFITAGPYGQGGDGANGPAETIGRTNVQVPSHTWKVVLALPAGKTRPEDVGPKTKTFALITPNNQTVREDWKQYQASVAEVEKLTGLSFFSDVPEKIAKEIKGTVRPGGFVGSRNGVAKKTASGGQTSKPSNKPKKPLKGGLDK